MTRRAISQRRLQLPRAAQGHTANKRHVRDLNPGLPAPPALILNHLATQPGYGFSSRKELSLIFVFAFSSLE